MIQCNYTDQVVRSTDRPSIRTIRAVLQSNAFKYLLAIISRHIACSRAPCVSYIESEK